MRIDGRFVIQAVLEATDRDENNLYTGLVRS